MFLCAGNNFVRVCLFVCVCVRERGTEKNEEKVHTDVSSTGGREKGENIDIALDKDEKEQIYKASEPSRK